MTIHYSYTTPSLDGVGWNFIYCQNSGHISITIFFGTLNLNMATKNYFDAFLSTDYNAEGWNLFKMNIQIMMNNVHSVLFYTDYD